MSLVSPAPLPARMRMSDRLRLFGEIVVAYIPLLRVLRTNDLRRMVAEARAVAEERAMPVPVDAHDQAVRLGWIVNRVLALFPTDGRCLMQSLVLTRLLAARSIDSTLIVGVHVATGFNAHAWVEHDGEAVLPVGPFEPLLRL